MKVSIKKNIFQKGIFERLPLKNFIYASFSLCVLGMVIIVFLKRYLPPEVPLFYGLPEGEEQLTNSLGLIIPLATSLAITILNTIIAYLLQNSFLQKTLVIEAFAVSVLSFITTIKIALLIGSF